MSANEQKNSDSMAGDHWGRLGNVNREESSVFFLNSCIARLSTMISIKISVRKNAWLTEAVRYRGKTEIGGDITLVSEGTLCNGCSL